MPMYATGAIRPIQSTIVRGLAACGRLFWCFIRRRREKGLIARPGRLRCGPVAVEGIGQDAVVVVTRGVVVLEEIRRLVDGI